MKFVLAKAGECELTVPVRQPLIVALPEMVIDGIWAAVKVVPAAADAAICKVPPLLMVIAFPFGIPEVTTLAPVPWLRSPSVSVPALIVMPPVTPTFEANITSPGPVLVKPLVPAKTALPLAPDTKVPIVADTPLSAWIVGVAPVR